MEDYIDLNNSGDEEDLYETGIHVPQGVANIQQASAPPPERSQPQLAPVYQYRQPLQAPVQPLSQPAQVPAQPQAAHASGPFPVAVFGAPTTPNPAVASPDVGTIRICLPNLADLSDDIIRSTPINVLVELNKSRSAAPTDGDFQTSAAKFLIAATAQLGGGGQREQEPSVQMAKALEAVQKNPTILEAGTDDRVSILHPARFLGGAVCSSTEMFVKAREQLGTDGATALCNYDMGIFGLPACVTMRGWKEIQNPGSSHITLKLFSPNNLQASTGSTRRLTLADSDGGINVGEQLSEIANLEELKLAMRALCVASMLATPWNHSFFAIDGGLHLINYGANELGGYPNRVGELVKFINHIILLNANAWTQKRPFLTAAEIRMKFPEWLACSTISLLKPAAAPAAQFSQPAPRNQNPAFSGPKNKRKGNKGGGNYYPPGTANISQQSSMAGQQANTAGQQVFPGRAATASQGMGAPPPFKYCKRFNVYGNCPNTYANCVIPGTTTRLAHLCNAAKANGQICNGMHATYLHR